MKRILPWVCVAVVVALTVFVLRFEGRLWWCSCDYLLLWSGDPWSSDNSQHLLDPYSFTHVLHGFVLCALISLVARRLPLAWKFWLAILVESLWEIVENSEAVIRHYRKETAALGYQGDTVINSLSDIVLCGLGFFVARCLGLRLGILVFVATELFLAIWIRDNLLLNVLMLVYPIPAVEAWQTAGH